MPYLMFIYWLAYLDRANLGVAKLQMQPQLGFTDDIIGFGAGIFFLGYLLLDLPGSLIVERWSARKWIAGIMVWWGVVAASMGFLHTRGEFYTLRLLLGISEAGFFPGVIVYLSHWFRVEDRARAKAYFMITQPVAIALGVPVSRWIMENVHWLGRPGWRWVFVLEGVPPIVLGVVTLFYLTDRPADARWLPADEKKWLEAELEAEARAKASKGRVSVADALRYPQTLLLMAICFLIVIGNQALIFFLPSIADNMRSLPVTARTLVAALPYALGAAAIFLNGVWAHRTNELRWHTAVPILATGVSLSLAILAGGHLWLVIALFCLAGATSQAYLPTFWSLPSTLLGKSAAATAVGLVALGNVGGFAGPWIFGALRTATGHYESGLWFLAGCMLVAGFLATRIRVPR